MEEKRIRLIDANALCQRIKEAYWIAQECGAHEMVVFYNALYEEVEQTKTVDAVEVVRCKDCKYLMFSDMYGECEKLLRIVRPDDFCSYGERK